MPGAPVRRMRRVFHADAPTCAPASDARATCEAFVRLYAESHPLAVASVRAILAEVGPYAATADWQSGATSGALDADDPFGERALTSLLDKEQPLLVDDAPEIRETFASFADQVKAIKRRARLTDRDEDDV